MNCCDLTQYKRKISINIYLQDGSYPTNGIYVRTLVASTSTKVDLNVILSSPELGLGVPFTVSQKFDVYSMLQQNRRSPYSNSIHIRILWLKNAQCLSCLYNQKRFCNRWWQMLGAYRGTWLKLQLVKLALAKKVLCRYEYRSYEI